MDDPLIYRRSYSALGEVSTVREHKDIETAFCARKGKKVGDFQTYSK